MHKDVNIAIAVAKPDGNLVVPVIKNAEQKNLVGLTKNLNQLAEAARKNKLTVEDYQGGTFTITNFGSFRNLIGTPIINQPQVAILGLGAVVKRPMVVKGADGGETIAIRSMVYLALSYDHRVVDGADAAHDDLPPLGDGAACGASVWGSSCNLPLLHGHDAMHSLSQRSAQRAHHHALAQTSLVAS